MYVVEGSCRVRDLCVAMSSLAREDVKLYDGSRDGVHG